MERANVLVIGNSGSGKSTLINAVLGEEKAETGRGVEGTTKELAIFESDIIPFRIIDTVGFEPSFVKQVKAINAVKKWSRDSIKDGNKDNKINVIWFCVEGTSSKLFPQTLKNLSRATSMWESIPIIVVITKSYSFGDRAKNIEMVNNAFAKEKRYSKNLRKVIPVVAAIFEINENAYAPPEGITELIDATNELVPEGIQAGEQDIGKFKLSRNRAMAHGITSLATTSAVVVAAIPIPFPDALILGPIEIALVNGLAQVYGINKNKESKKFISTIVEVGTVGLVAKTAINALKAIPGINLGASVVNAIVAGSIVAALGGGTIYAFEQIYLGKKDIEDLEWLKEIMESKVSSNLTEGIISATNTITDKMDTKSIARIIQEIFKSSFKGSDDLEKKKERIPE